MFRNDRHSFHAARKKWKSGNGRVLLRSNFLGANGITNREAPSDG